MSGSRVQRKLLAVRRNSHTIFLCQRYNAFKGSGETRVIVCYITQKGRGSCLRSENYGKTSKVERLRRFFLNHYNHQIVAIIKHSLWRYKTTSGDENTFLHSLNLYNHYNHQIVAITKSLNHQITHSYFSSCRARTIILLSFRRRIEVSSIE